MVANPRPLFADGFTAAAAQQISSNKNFSMHWRTHDKGTFKRLSNLCPIVFPFWYWPGERNFARISKAASARKDLIGSIIVHSLQGCMMIVFVVLPAVAQAQADTLRYSIPAARDSNDAGVRFERNLNTYLWNFRADYSARDSEFAADVHDRYSSSFIRQDQSSLRDEQTLWLNASRKISSALDLDVEASSFILSDNQSLDVSNAALHTGLVGVSIRPVPYVSVSPLVGFRVDRQQDQTDQGWNYKLSSEMDTVDIDGYQTLASMRLNVSNLSPRYFRNNGAQMFFQKDFLEGSFDSLRLQWSNNRWDFYVPADSVMQKEFGVEYNIRSRVDEIYNVSNSLHYAVGKEVSAVVQTLVEARTISNAFRYKSLLEPTLIPYDITVQEQRLEGGLDINYHDVNNVFGSIGIHAGERDERHILQKIDGVDKDIEQSASEQETQLDNVARRTSLRGIFSMPVSSSDFVSFESSAGILRYDTPDSTNTDDRDELLITLSGRESHRWNEYFEMSVTAEVTLNHIVYLFADRSANNNWNRIFRLAPELTYSPSPALRSVNTFEVLANYTVFDYETIVPTVESYSYRQFAFLDSTSYDISWRTALDVLLHIRLYERGQLQWKEFSERPQQYFEEVTFSPALRYTIQDRIVCAAGFRSFVQNRFRYDGGTRVTDGSYFSYGPTTSIVMMVPSGWRLEIQGWKEFQKETNQPIREVSNIMMSAKANF